MDRAKLYSDFDSTLPALVPSEMIIERAVLASIADGVVVNDVSGYVVLINQSAARILCVEQQTARGQIVQELYKAFSPRGRIALTDAIERLYADPYSYAPGEGITETIIEAGMRVIQAHLSPVLTEMGDFVGVVTVLRDITREVEAERAKTDFISNVSHELRTPLTSIKGYSDLMVSNATGTLNPAQREFMRTIQTNAERLTMLINDLLDISRIEGGRFELLIAPMDVAEVLRDVYAMLQPECARKHQQLMLSIEPEMPCVLGDRQRLTQVVTNLVSNASRYTPDGGTITLALTAREGSVRVDVADTGIGIAPEDHAKIFQRFYRARHPAVMEVVGTGLGLPIARLLTEMHGGRLWVESELGRGSVFTFILPLQSEQNLAAMAGKPAPERPKHTVLVVEDQPEVAQFIANDLREQGLYTLTASYGEDAVKLAQTQSVDLITLDMLLPDINGMEVLRRLKADARTAKIPVIVVSVINPEDTTKHWSVGGDGRRPFALEKLIASIHQALGMDGTR